MDVDELVDLYLPTAGWNKDTVGNKLVEFIHSKGLGAELIAFLDAAAKEEEGLALNADEEEENES